MIYTVQILVQELSSKFVKIPLGGVAPLDFEI
jgi:hypothetical protein